MKYIYIAFSLLFINTVSAIQQTDFTLSNKVLQNSDLEFKAHSGQGRFSNYLAMNIKFQPVKDLLTQLRNHKNIELKSRGEAHITVITPIEFNDILKKKNVTMKQIDSIANKHKIQNTQFQILCLGSGSLFIDRKSEKTYFIVVRSNELIKIRKEIQSIYISNGGKAKDFRPMHFYPHITIGFTERDLHESDGVIKNVDSCIADIFIK